MRPERPKEKKEKQLGADEARSKNNYEVQEKRLKVLIRMCRTNCAAESTEDAMLTDRRRKQLAHLA